jgi:hypothetical protein
LRLEGTHSYLVPRERTTETLSTGRARLRASLTLFLVAFLITLPAVVALLFITTYAGAVPMFDELQFVALFAKFYDGNLAVRDLFVQWGEHRSGFSYLLMLLLGVATHYSTVAECYLSWVLLCLINVLLFAAWRRTFGTRQGAVATFIPITWLTFNLGQADNLLWGFQVQFFVLILCFVCAIYVLATHETRWSRFSLALATGVACTFSMGSGFLVWPVGLMLILWLGRVQAEKLRRAHLKLGLLWCSIGLLSTIAYFNGYNDPSRSIKLQCFIDHKYLSAQYFLAALGIIMHTSADQVAAILAGCLLLPLYVYAAGAVFRRRVTSVCAALSLSLILWTMVSVLMMTVSRSCGGITDAVASRHATIGILGLVGLYMALLSLTPSERRSFLLGTLAGFIVMGSSLSSYYAIKEMGPLWQNYSNWHKYLLSSYKVQSDESIRSVFPWDSHTARDAAAVLDKYRLNLFSWPSLDSSHLARIEGPVQFLIDTVNDSRPGNEDQAIGISERVETVTIVGWAIDRRLGNPAGRSMVAGIFPPSMA